MTGGGWVRLCEAVLLIAGLVCAQGPVEVADTKLTTDTHSDEQIPSEDSGLKPPEILSIEMGELQRSEHSDHERQERKATTAHDDLPQGSQVGGGPASEDSGQGVDGIESGTQTREEDTGNQRDEDAPVIGGNNLLSTSVLVDESVSGVQDVVLGERERASEGDIRTRKQGFESDLGTDENIPKPSETANKAGDSKEEFSGVLEEESRTDEGSNGDRMEVRGERDADTGPGALSGRETEELGGVECDTQTPTGGGTTEGETVHSRGAQEEPEMSEKPVKLVGQDKPDVELESQGGGGEDVTGGGGLEDVLVAEVAEQDLVGEAGAERSEEGGEEKEGEREGEKKEIDKLKDEEALQEEPQREKDAVEGRGDETEYKGEEKEEEGEEKDEEDVLTFEEFKQKKLQEQGATQTPPETLPNTIASKSKNNYASLDCGAKVIAANQEAQNRMAVLMENRDLYMLNPCSAEIWFIVELCELVSVHTLEIACFELFSSIPESFSVYVSERYPDPEWIHLGTFQAANVREVQSFPLATDETVYAKYIKVEMLSYYGNEHYCPLSLMRVLGASMMEVFEYSESQKEQQSPQQSQSVVLPPSEGEITGEDELLMAVGEERVGKRNGTLLSTAKDVVLSFLDKPLSLLGKVNGLMKPEEGGGGCEECQGKEEGGEVGPGDQQGTEKENSSLARTESPSGESATPIIEQGVTDENLGELSEEPVISSESETEKTRKKDSEFDKTLEENNAIESDNVSLETAPVEQQDAVVMETKPDRPVPSTVSNEESPSPSVSREAPSNTPTVEDNTSGEEDSRSTREDTEPSQLVEPSPQIKPDLDKPSSGAGGGSVEPTDSVQNALPVLETEEGGAGDGDEKLDKQTEAAGGAGNYDAVTNERDNPAINISDETLNGEMVSVQTLGPEVPEVVHIELKGGERGRTSDEGELLGVSLGPPLQSENSSIGEDGTVLQEVVQREGEGRKEVGAVNKEEDGGNGAEENATVAAQEGGSSDPKRETAPEDVQSDIPSANKSNQTLHKDTELSGRSAATPNDTTENLLIGEPPSSAQPSDAEAKPPRNGSLGGQNATVGSNGIHNKPNESSQQFTGNGASVPSPMKEKSVFLRLSNRIRDLEENMSLFSSYLDQISTSLKRNKNRTEDAQKLLDRRVSALNESLQSLKQEMELSAVGLGEVVGGLKEVASLLESFTSGLEDMKEELSSQQLQTAVIHLGALLLLLLLFCLWMRYQLHSHKHQLQQLRTEVARIPPLGHVTWAPNCVTSGVNPGNHIRGNLSRNTLIGSQKPREWNPLASGSHSSLETSDHDSEPWQIAESRRKKKSSKTRNS